MLDTYPTELFEGGESLEAGIQVVVQGDARLYGMKRWHFPRHDKFIHLGSDID